MRENLGSCGDHVQQRGWRMGPRTAAWVENGANTHLGMSLGDVISLDLTASLKRSFLLFYETLEFPC